MKKVMSFKEIAGYSLGLFGFQAIVGFLNSYQAEFYHAQMAANLAVVGILILVVKVVSAVFDPVVGNLIERGKSPKGKLRPFILYSLAPLLVMTVVVFLRVPLTGTALYAYIFVTFLLWSMAMTLGDVPSQAIASVLTPEPTERTNVISIANTFKQVGFSAAAVLVPVVCLIVPGGSKVFGIPKGEKDAPISSSEYFAVAVLVAVLGCLLFSPIYFWNQERVAYASEKMTFREMFASLRENKPLILVIVTAVGSMISMALPPMLIKKLGEKITYIALSLYGFVVSVAAYLVYVFVTDHMVVMLIFLFLVGLQFGAVTLMPMIMVTDCVDYEEYRTGKRREGPAFSVLTLTIKVCLAVGAALGLILVQASGYQAEAAAVTAHTKNVIYFAYVAMPGIFSLLSVFPILKYDISGEKKRQITEALAQRRES